MLREFFDFWKERDIGTLYSLSTGLGPIRLDLKLDLDFRFPPEIQIQNPKSKIYPTLNSIWSQKLDFRLGRLGSLVRLPQAAYLHIALENGAADPDVAFYHPFFFGAPDPQLPWVRRAQKLWG